MKLFEEAGYNGSFSVIARMTNLRAKQKRIIGVLNIIAAGIILGSLMAMVIGIDVPATLFAVIVFVLCGTSFITTARSLFRSKEISISLKERHEKAGFFMVNKHQLMWVTPVGDIPLFQKGYKITKETIDSKGVTYICKGKASRSFTSTLKHLILQEHIWSCRHLTLRITPDTETHPKAIAVLEMRYREGNAIE